MAEDAARHDDVHLTLCLTHDCNLRCRYCYGGAKTSRHMSWETALKALDLAFARVSKRLHLVFFGGEPVLRWEMLQRVMGEARDRAAVAGVDLRPTVTTNGTLLTRDRARWLAEQGFVVAISCDGVPEAHDANRVDAKGCGSHNLTVQGIRLALETRAVIRCILVLDPSNVAFLPDSIEHLREVGARDFVVNPNWIADWSPQSVREAWATAYDAVAEQYVDAWQCSDPFWISILDSKIAAHIKGGYVASDLCDLGRKNIVVAPGGNLYPCDRLVGEDGQGPSQQGGYPDGQGPSQRSPELVLGHVSSGVVPARVRAIVAPSDTLPAECLTCAIARRCLNRCVCANLAMSGTLHEPSDTLCFHEQLAVRCADRAATRLVEEGNQEFVRHHYGSAV